MSIDDLEKVADVLTPPGWNPSKRLKFDLAVVGSIGVMALIGGYHIAQACGFLAWMGLPGFALANDFTAQQMQLTAIQAGQVQTAIDRDRTAICQAQAQHNQSALTAWSLSLQRDISIYWQIPAIKQQPRVLSCDELLITGSNG